MFLVDLLCPLTGYNLACQLDLHYSPASLGLVVEDPHVRIVVKVIHLPCVPLLPMALVARTSWPRLGDGTSAFRRITSAEIVVCPPDAGCDKGDTRSLSVPARTWIAEGRIPPIHRLQGM